MHLILFVLYPYFVAAIAGILRFLSGLPMAFSLALALPAAFCLCLTLAYEIPAAERRISARVFVPALLCLTLIAGLLWLRTFWGLSTLGCADAGTHAGYARMFWHAERRVYNGFITLYAFYYAAKVLGVDFYGSAVAGIYYAVVFCACFAAFFLERVFPKASLLQRCFALSISALFAVPLLFCLQGEGYLPQIFGFIPLAAAMLLFATLENSVGRIACLCAGLILTRYTYGLNLADLLFATAAAAAIESRQSRRVVARRLMLGLAVCSLCAAFVALHHLRAIFSVPGAILYVNWRLGCAGIALSGLTFGALASLRLRGNAPESSVRLWRIVSWFLLASAASLLLLRMTTGGHYYAMKYTVLPALLVLMISPSALLLLRTLPEPRAKVLQGLLPVSLLLLGGAYKEWVTEYVYAETNWPLAMPPVIEFVRNTLEREQKRFGGYLTQSWPRYCFLNAGFGGTCSRPRQLAAKVERGAGHCVFAERETVTPEVAPLTGAPHHSSFQVPQYELEGEPETAFHYEFRLDATKTEHLEIRYRCF